MNKKMTLTSEMQRALDIIKEHGSIDRYPGGFWARPCADMVHSGGCPPFDYPKGFVGTVTLKALLTRGLIKATAKVKGHCGIFAVKYTLDNKNLITKK
jgi:hypothetical protein